MRSSVSSTRALRIESTGKWVCLWVTYRSTVGQSVTHGTREKCAERAEPTSREVKDHLGHYIITHTNVRVTRDDQEQVLEERGSHEHGPVSEGVRCVVSVCVCVCGGGGGARGGGRQDYLSISEEAPW